MDVRFFFFCLALWLAGCASKTPESVFVEQSVRPACSEARIHGEYLVQWEDGRVSVERGTSRESFRDGFVTDNLHLIKSVETHKRIQIPVSVRGEVSTHSVAQDWGQVLSEVAAAWSAGAEGQGVAVAVLDTPVDFEHPLLKDGVLYDSEGNPGWDFDRNAVAAPATVAVHGTHVAGIVGSRHSGTRNLGVAPKSSLIIGSFLGDNGGGTMMGAISALKYAQSRRAKVVNASWGGSDCSITLNETLRDLDRSGILTVVASGNDGNDLDLYPDYPAVLLNPLQITVAALRPSGHMEIFSNTSYRYVNIAAPGVDIVSTIPSGRFAAMSGTSMAAPFVSGAAAALWSHRPLATPQQIKEALLRSVDPGPYRVSTQGRLNLRKALGELERLVDPQ